MPKLSAGFAKQYAKRDILVPHLNNWFARGVFPDDIPVIIHPNKEDDKAYHPSSATTCAQVLYAQRCGDIPRETTSGDQEKNFMFGHYIHGLIYFILQDLGFSTEAEIEVEIGTRKDWSPWVRGFVDVQTCRIPGHDEPFLIDIKSQQARLFSSEPQPALLHKYTTQVQLYLHFSGREQAIILWAEKDSPHRMKETIIKPDPEYIESILDRWATVDHALKIGVPPECTCGRVLNCPAFKLYV